MSDKKFGTFDELLELATEPMRPVAARLRAMILGLDSDAVDVVRLGDRAATYGVGPKKMSEGYAYILPYAEWVNLGFYRGTDLPDPDDLLEGTGARMRHVKIRNVDAAEDERLESLVLAALAERRAALGL